MLQPLRMLAMLFLNKIAVPYFAPAIIEPIAKIKICRRVPVGS